MLVTQKRTNIILQALQEKHDVEYCGHYGEPGYQDPAAGIVFANWNNISKRVYSYLELAGFECEWSDAWTIDYNNDKAYRTSPDCYQWVSQIAYTDDGEILTPDDSIADWIGEMSMTDQAQRPRALPDWITAADIEAEGYQAINGDYESGFHPGQTDKPDVIAKSAFDRGAVSVVFRIKETSQFYIVFQGYAHYGEVQS